MIHPFSKSSPLTGWAPPRTATLPTPPLQHGDMTQTQEPRQPPALPQESPLPPAENPSPAPKRNRRAGQGESESLVLVLRGAQALAPWVTAWQELADAAGEPNVFYEPWMLLPALATFAPASAPEFHLIFAPGCGPNSPRPQLCGLFPLVRGRRYKGLRVQTLSLWKHLYCALCTPLLRRGAEIETLHVLFDFLAAQPRGASLLELPYVSADGPFGRALVDVFSERRTTTFLDESWTRAVMRPQDGQSGEDYLKRTMPGKRRKEFRRKEHRLAEEGALQYVQLETEADPDAALETYIEDFLRVEASGWKGERGSAFACHPAHREFFCAIVRQAHRRNRLMLSALRVGGRTVASRCDFRAANGAFAFKIGFDEEFAHFSPGVLLQIEGIRQLHEKENLTWIDSCAVRDHPMINRLWLERRTLQNVVAATGRGRGEFVVASLSLMRYFKRLAARISKIARAWKQRNAPSAAPDAAEPETP